MAPTSPRLKILSVGGNAVSAFLSWRLQATNACDVTLVWKNGFESVSQYGISFKSELFGNERFKPRYVVRSPEEAGQTAQGMFDYVVLCVKALPDVYDLGAIIESVVTPQHTCILINTSHAIGVESLIEQRFPKNVVLSLVSSAEVAQLGSSEFEHHGSTNMWVGPANQNSDIPVSIQSDMAEALAMTLASGSVECKVSKNIQQQQFERMVGPIAFHPASVLFETPTHSALLDLKSVRPMIIDVIDELKRVAEAGGCIFPSNFRDKVMEDMIVATDSPSTMYQDYTAKRPMEVETYLGGPLRIAQNRKIPVPRLETLYAFLHHINIINQQRPAPQPAPVNGNHSAANGGPQPPMRLSSAPPPRQSMNGYGPQPNGRGPRAPSMAGPPPGMRSRGPPPNGMNGTNGMNGMNGMNGGMPPPRGPPGHMKRRPSFDDSLDEFGYLSMYGEDSVPGLVDGPAGPGPAPAELALRERELALRERELAMKERGMGGGPRMSRGPRRPQTVDAFDDDDDEGDYFDAMAYRGPPVNPDNVDMMSITSRRNRKAPTNMGQYRSNPEMGGMPRRGNPFSRGPRNRQSSGLMNEVGNLRDNVMENPMLAYSSDRYGGVDRSNLGRESRTNSLTSVRLSEMQQQAPYGGYPQPPINRRTSQSPGNPFGPSNMGNGYPPMSPGGRPPPPDMRQPVPRHPPGHGNTVAPQQVEQRAGVSNLYPPPKGNAMRSLTGSASASAGSGDSGRSAHVDSENSAYSSQSSLGPRPQIGVR